MSEAQTLSFPKAAAASRLRTYRLLFTISIVIEAAIGLYGIACPVSLARLLLLPDPYPEAWARIWAATLIGLQIVYVPGVRNPLFYRWPNWASIAMKLFMAVVFLCAGAHFLVPAAWSLLWAVVLFVAYYRLLMADLACNP